MVLAAQALHAVDWLVIGLCLVGTIGVGLYFTRRAGSDIDSFYVSGRALPWYLAGVSMIATSFASDTPLWISSLVRQYGVYYLWQYWTPAIGSALAVVLFARLWRRLGILTDVEFMELRYSGRAAAAQRFWIGFTLAIFFCPLIIGWVTKAMEVITRVAMGLPEEYRPWTTALVILVALGSCTLSGLWGVVYTDFVQFLLATGGTVALACFAVHEVGGLDAMVVQLQAMSDWSGRGLNILPSIGPGGHQMSVWNAIGYFGILWISVALSGGYNAQRLLACRDSRHATLAMLLHTIVYYAVICWPWVLIGLCSLILFPGLTAIGSHDAAYPHMIVTLLPIGLRGVLVAAMLAAFMSTISTLFNWGSSYLVNDIYRRFLVRRADPRHYVTVGRVATLLMAALGGLISYLGEDIQQLLTIAYVVGAGPSVVGLMRWFWWRLNAVGDLAANVVAWVVAPVLLFPCGLPEPLLDAPMRIFLGPDSHFSSDPDLLGARMLFMVILVAVVAFVVSCMTPPTTDERLAAFVRQARPFKIFWRPVADRLGIEYPRSETLRRTLVSWAVMGLCVYALLLGIGKFLLGASLAGAIWMAVFAVTLVVTVIRIGTDLDDAPDADRVAPCASEPVALKTAQKQVRSSGRPTTE